MQDLIGENRQQRGRAPEKDGENVERDRGQDHLFGANETQSFHQAAPRISFGAAAAIAAPDREHEQEKRKRAGGVDRINKWKSGADDEQPTERRPDDRADLKDAAVPGNGVRENIARDELRKVGAARRPTKSAARRGDEQDQINQRDREIVEMEIGGVALENRGDGKQETISGPQKSPVR